MPVQQNRRRALDLRRAIAAAVAVFLGVSSTLGGTETEPPETIRIEDPLPSGQSSIQYFQSETDEMVRPLADRLASGKAEFEWREPHGYLVALLKSLRVPVESQMLVFSKTALNPNLVTPRNPRAVYFSDEVTVGWVPGADALEITAIDPRRGAIFYVLPQKADVPPRLKREDRCLACHVGNTTHLVPGLMVRSFLTDATGKPTAGYSRVTHATPFENRFGGWYVTGRHADQPHSGNLFGDDAGDRQKRDPLAEGNLVQLESRLDCRKYPLAHSDLVAQLVFQHQAHGTNLIIRVNQEAQLNRRSDAEEQLARYLVFADEAPLPEKFAGTSSFATVYETDGAAEGERRPLRALLAGGRLYRHRLSPLVETRAFQQMPSAARERVLRKIEAFITSDTPIEGWPEITREEREFLQEWLRRLGLRPLKADPNSPGEPPEQPAAPRKRSPG